MLGSGWDTLHTLSHCTIKTTRGRYYHLSSADEKERLREVLVMCSGLKVCCYWKSEDGNPGLMTSHSRSFPIKYPLSLWTWTLVCANDQTWINVYKQGMNITKLISGGHIYISPSVSLSHLFEWRFPQFTAVSHCYPSVTGNVLEFHKFVWIAILHFLAKAEPQSIFLQ